MRFPFLRRDGSRVQKEYPACTVVVNPTKANRVAPVSTFPRPPLCGTGRKGRANQDDGTGSFYPVSGSSGKRLVAAGVVDSPSTVAHRLVKTVRRQSAV